MKEIEQSDVYEVGFEDELDFGGFWYINFANLQQKNMELLDDIAKVDAPTRKKRSKSFS